LQYSVEHFVPGTLFFAHLGNVQAANASCSKSHYQEVASILKKSTVTTMVVPGANDYAHCSDPAKAFYRWKSYLGFFETYFTNDFTVKRQFKREENFAFFKDGVLVIGIHITAAKIANWTAHHELMSDNTAWVAGMIKDHKNTTRAQIVLGNAAPGLPQHATFFDTMSKIVASTDKPTAYIHANRGAGKIFEYYPFKEAPKLEAIQIVDGNKGTPMRITVGFGDDPFILS
jgi:hypothetical protein